MDTSFIKEGYNKFSSYPDIAYNCVSYLLSDSNSELLWKLLFYNDADAWKTDTNHPTLTIEQKRSLIYAGEQDQTSYRVFLDFGMDDAWDVEATQIRIGALDLVPSNNIVGYITMAFEVYSHFRVNTLSNRRTRIDIITQSMLSAFNGEHVEGIGTLYFNARATRQCRSVLIGKIPYKGRRTIMCNWIT